MRFRKHVVPRRPVRRTDAFTRIGADGAWSYARPKRRAQATRYETDGNSMSPTRAVRVSKPLQPRKPEDVPDERNGEEDPHQESEVVARGPPCHPGIRDHPEYERQGETERGEILDVVGGAPADRDGSDEEPRTRRDRRDEDHQRPEPFHLPASTARCVCARRPEPPDREMISESWTRRKGRLSLRPQASPTVNSSCAIASRGRLFLSFMDHRLLLRQAVQGSQSEDQVDAMDAHDLAIRKQTRQGIECDRGRPDR